MTNKDYPYKAKDQTCAHDETKTIGKTKEWGIDGRNNVQKMKDRLKKQPGAVALSASSRQFQFYKSGTLKQCCDPSDTSCREDRVPINHAVTIVGYSEGSSSKTVRKCSVEDWWVSCKDEKEEGSGEDAQGDTNYWKLQNSWGKGWGDNGFIKFEIQDGNGVCGINRNGIHWASWDHESEEKDDNDDENDENDEEDEEEDEKEDESEGDDSTNQCFIKPVYAEKEIQQLKDIQYGSAYNHMTEQ